MTSRTCISIVYFCTGSIQPYHIGALGASAPVEQSPSPVAHDSAEVIANKNMSTLSPQLESAQNELVHLVNTIVATYSTSPDLMSSLQINLSGLLPSIPPGQSNTMQQQTQTHTDVKNTAQTSNREPVLSIIDGVIRFLAQRQSSVIPSTVHGNSTYFLPPTSSMSMMQQQNTAPPLLPSDLQHCNPQIQQTGSSFLLSSPNVQALWGNQAQLHQHIVRRYGSALPNNTDSATTTTSSSNYQEDTNADVAASVASFSHDADENPTAQATSSTESQTIPPENNRKRARSSPSPDK